MRTAQIGPDLRLRRFLLLFPMWWKENSDNITKLHIQGHVFHFPQNAQCLKTMFCARVYEQADREILSVTE